MLQPEARNRFVIRCHSVDTAAVVVESVLIEISRYLGRSMAEIR
jgi:hypothetical protein